MYGMHVRIGSGQIQPLCTFHLNQVDPSQFSFNAGQWIDFWAPGFKEIGGFSVVSTPQQLRQEGTIDLGVKATRHPVAQWICSQAAAGDKVGHLIMQRELNRHTWARGSAGASRARVGCFPYATP